MLDIAHVALKNLEDMVNETVTSYGHSNRGKVMQGSLRVQLGASCKAISQRSISLALQTVASEAN